MIRFLGLVFSRNGYSDGKGEITGDVNQAEKTLGLRRGIG